MAYISLTDTLLFALYNKSNCLTPQKLWLPKARVRCSCRIRCMAEKLLYRDKIIPLWTWPPSAHAATSTRCDSTERCGWRLQAAQRIFCCQGSVDSLCKAVLQIEAPQTRGYNSPAHQTKPKQSSGCRHKLASKLVEAGEVQGSRGERGKLFNHVADAFCSSCGRVAPMVAKI